MLARFDNVFPWATRVTAVTAVVGLLSSPLLGQPARSWCGTAFATGINVPVTLTGVVTHQVEWGPPGFGENPRTDSSFVAWILNLDFSIPVVVDDGPGMPPKTITLGKLQLRGMQADTVGYDEFLGRHVSAQGILFEG